MGTGWETVKKALDELKQRRASASTISSSQYATAAVVIYSIPTTNQQPAAPRLKYSTPLSSLFLSSCFDFSFPPQTAYDY
jgi:hypothetical protein